MTEPEDVARKHFLDSLTFFRAANPPEGASLADVGSGAGFPGVALLIARPDLRVTLLDSSGKKTLFLRELLRRLELPADVVKARAEDAARGELRERFDYVTARAVAPLNVLLELCLPLTKTGGEFVALKGAKAAEEVEGACCAATLLGAGELNLTAFTLPGAGERGLVAARKIAPVPPEYPRSYAKIASSPL